MSFAHRSKRAVFLDRDGVLNASVVRDGKPYPPHTLEEFQLLPGTAEACDRLHRAGFALVVATNQPDVGRGQLAQSLVEQMHEQMRRQLPLDRIEVCYDPGGETPSECRKPRPGMLLRAAEALKLDLPGSYMIGDRWRDVDCGRAAGCITIFIDLGYDEPLRTLPHFRAPNLPSAVDLILSQPDLSQHG